MLVMHKNSFLLQCTAILMILLCTNSIYAQEPLSVTSSDNKFYVLTRTIKPAQLSVKVNCVIKSKHKLPKEAVFEVYPESDDFSNILQEKNTIAYIVCGVGDGYQQLCAITKITGYENIYDRDLVKGLVKRELVVTNYMSFHINGVSQRNNRVVVAPINSPSQDVQLQCSF